MVPTNFDFSENKGKNVTIETADRLRTGLLLGLMPDNIVVLDISDSFNGQLALSEIELSEILSVEAEC
ncbi:MAG: hypothetical protein ACK5KP_09390 [Paludibacteraceae bacterium]